MSGENTKTMIHLKTLKLRVKDKHASLLARMARDVNTVFNFCNELSSRAIRERQQWMTAYDLQKYVAGYTKCDGVEILSTTADIVCEEYATRRRQFRRMRLRWRVSNPKSPKHSLGWVPLKSGCFRLLNGQIRYAGHFFSPWDSYGLAGHKMRTANFSQDARGRWYFNVTVEVQPPKSAGTVAVGIDLGLKTTVTCSDGQRLEGRQFRASEERLGKALRARKNRQARTIHAKIKNQRKDAQHKLSSALVKQYAAIFVGDVSSAKLIKTRMAKSTLDAAWGQFKRTLEYKCDHAGVLFQVVDESYSTQTCSSCASVEGPKGVAGLGVRQWRCSCGVEHDRDVNAAKVIAARGLASLEAGAGASNGGRSSQPSGEVVGGQNGRTTY